MNELANILTGTGVLAGLFVLAVIIYLISHRPKCSVCGKTSGSKRICAQCGKPFCSERMGYSEETKHVTRGKLSSIQGGVKSSRSHSYTCGYTCVEFHSSLVDGESSQEEHMYFLCKPCFETKNSTESKTAR